MSGIDEEHKTACTIQRTNKNKKIMRWNHSMKFVTKNIMTNILLSIATAVTLLLSAGLSTAAKVIITSANGEVTELKHYPACSVWTLEKGSTCRDNFNTSVPPQDPIDPRVARVDEYPAAEVIENGAREKRQPGVSDKRGTIEGNGNAKRRAKVCKTKIVTGPTRCANGRLSTPIAKNRAKNAWEDSAEDLHGAEWRNWSRAEDKDKIWWGPDPFAQPGMTCAYYLARPCAKEDDVVEAEPQPVPVLSTTHPVDVDGDNQSDIIFVGQNWSGAGLNIRVKMSNGDGTYTHHSSVLGDGPGVHINPALVGDYDGDGRTDIAFVGQNWSGTGLNIRTKISNGNGTWTPHSQIMGDGPGVHSNPALVGDYDGDGRSDIAFVGQNWSGSGLNIRVKMSNGDGTYTAYSQVLGDSIWVHTHPALVGDFNDDGRSDIAFVGQGWSGLGLNIRVKMSNGDGTWTSSSQIMGDGPGVHTNPTLVGDFDGDGSTDLAFVGQNWSGVGLNIRVKMSNGDGTFTPHSQVLGDGAGVHQNAALTADFDGDGRTDIAFVGQNWSGAGLNIRIKHSNGDGNWNGTSQIMGDGPGVHAHPALIGTIDDNNRADIIFIGQGWSGAGLNIRTKLSQTSGLFTPVSQIHGDGPGVHVFPAHCGPVR